MVRYHNIRLDYCRVIQPNGFSTLFVSLRISWYLWVAITIWWVHHGYKSSLIMTYPILYPKLSSYYWKRDRESQADDVLGSMLELSGRTGMLLLICPIIYTSPPARFSTIVAHAACWGLWPVCFFAFPPTSIPPLRPYCAFPPRRIRVIQKKNICAMVI